MKGQVDRKNITLSKSFSVNCVIDKCLEPIKIINLLKNKTSVDVFSQAVFRRILGGPGT